MNKYLKPSYVIVALLGLGLIITITCLVYWSAWQTSVNLVQVNNTTDQAMQATSTPSTTGKISPGKVAPDATKAYTDALKTYASRRVQMSNCVASPTKMTFKNNTTLLFDTRDSTAIDVRIDGKSNYIAALSFRLITLSSAALPHTVDIDCYKAGTPKYNVASVVLQK